MIRLLRFALRRDRWSVAVWVLLNVAMVAGTASRYRELFVDAAAQQAFVSGVLQNRALTAFGGELFAANLGTLVVFKVGSTLYTLMAICALLAVIRHTRDDEEAGRLELVRAGVVQPWQPLVVGWSIAVGTVALIAGSSAVVLIKAGHATSGAWALALGLLTQGLVFASVGAVTAQLSASARTARFLGGAVIAVSYVLRFFADGAQLSWVRWLSVEGWSHELRPFAGDRFVVFLLPLLVAAALLGLALRLNSSRDFGSGVLAATPGPERAPQLRSAWSLAWRLQRNGLVGWAVGFFVFALLLGSIRDTMPELIDRAGLVAKTFFERYATPGAPLSDAFSWLMVSTFGFAVSLFAVLSMLRVRAEEVSGNGELLLSTSMSRLAWVGSHAAISFVGSAVLLSVVGLAMGLLGGDPGRMWWAAVVQVPAAWVLSGLTLAAFGVVPRAAVAIGWAAFIWTNVFGEILGPALGLDFEAADRLVPFHYVPKVLMGDTSLTPLLGLIAVSVMFSALGVWRLRERDLA